MIKKRIKRKILKNNLSILAQLFLSFLLQLWKNLTFKTFKQNITRFYRGDIKQFLHTFKKPYLLEKIKGSLGNSCSSLV